VTFAALAAGSAASRSATWDEPIHLTAGYAALVERDFRIDPSHPPLQRMWAALPLLAMDAVRLDRTPVDRSAPAAWLTGAYAFAHRFMYVDNDADRMLAAARAMVVLLAIALGLVLFRWAQEWLGVVPALAVLALFALEPNLLAHGSLVTTDLGLTAFVFGAVYFLWRTCHAPTRLNVLATAACAALASVTKFSAVVLAPILIALLAIALVRRLVTMRTAATVLALTAAMTFAAIWTVYGLRYRPSDSPSWTFQVADSDLAARRPVLAAAIAWVDARRLLPNAYTQGFLYTQVSAESMPSFLAGERRDGGWWYYLPAAFVLKTPLAVLLLGAAGALIAIIAAGRGRPPGVDAGVFVVVPIVVFTAVAIASGINLGIRHLLPVYPFVLLLAALAVKSMLASERRWVRVAVAVIAVGGVAEFVRAYPYPLTFFNQLAGGPAQGYRYLADSNLGWGGNLKRLKAWMDREGTPHINLAYFGQADPAYYGMAVTHLPGAPGFALDAVARPRLPGYVAISPTIMHGVYAPPEWRLFYAPFAALTPVTVIGHSLRVYWVDEWPMPAHVRPEEIAAQRRLGDALLLGLQWPELAAQHYRDYLTRRPGDVDARVQLGIALVAAGREAEALDALHAAVAAGPAHGHARLMLARALFGSGDLAGAGTHGGEAVRLLAADADAHDFLGRVRAAQGRFREALTLFQHALRLEPTHADARAHLARLTGGS
jgi:tetratricopeptide (TPR) repeat protein